MSIPLALTPHETGAICGQLVLVTLLLLGVLKCVHIARRPTTSTPCVLSLALVLSVWLISVLVSMAQEHMLPASVWGEVVRTLLLAPVLVAALVLAIVGLALYRPHDPPYVQGRAQAIWTLVLGTCLLGLMGAAAIVGIYHAFADGAAGPLAATPSTDRGLAAATPQDFPEFNVQLTPPDAQWVSMDPKALHPDAAAAFRQKHPEVYFIALLEKTAPGDGFTLPLFAEVAVANIKDAAEAIYRLERHDKTIDGVPGEQVQAEVLISGTPLAYDNWAGVNGPFAYQFAVWGSRNDQQAVSDAAAKWARGIRFTDPGPPPVAPLPPVVKPALGFRVDWPEGWQPWSKFGTDFPAAAVGAVRHGGTVPFAVVALDLGDLEPSDHDLARALLSLMDFDYPGDEVESVKPVTHGDAQGLELTLRSLRKKEMAYTARVFRRGRMGYMLVTWTISGFAEYDAAEVLDAVTLFDPDGSVPERPPAMIKEHAEAINQIGLAAYERGAYADAERAMRRAMEMAPDNLVYFQNVLECLDNQERYADAITMIEGRGPRFEGNHELEAARASYLGMLGKNEEAAAAFAALFDAGYWDNLYFEDFLYVLLALDRDEEILTRLDAAIAERPTRFNHLVRADLLRRLGRSAEAAEAMQAYRQGRPPDVEVYERLIWSLLDLERYAEALAAADEAIAAGLDTAEMRYTKGRSELGLKWYPQAKESFEAALAKEPATEVYQSYLDYASGLLGQGSNSMVKRPIEAVPIPQAVLDAVAARRAERPPTAETGYAYRILESFSCYDYAESARTTLHRRIVIDEQRGVDQLSTLTFRFDPLAEDIYVNHLRVLDAEGHVVATANVDSFYVVDDVSSGMATQDKELNVPVPGLRVGHTIEYAVTWETRPAPERFDFTRYLFSNRVPTAFEAFSVRGVDDLQAWASDGVDEVAGPDWRAWIAFNPPLYRRESWQPPSETYLPTVIVNGGGVTWESLAETYLDEIKDRLTPTAEVRELAATLLEGVADDPYLRVLTLARHVQQEYTYKAIEFGRRARVPNLANQVIHDRFGDCKDHAVLLQQLLAAADIPAHLVLLQSYFAVRADMPSLDQFDHMIVYVPEIGGGLYIDATNKDGPAASSNPPAYRGYRVLLLDPDNPRLVEVAGPAEPIVVRSERTIRIEANGDAVVEERFESYGLEAESMRDYLRSYEPAKRLDAVQGWLGRYGIRMDALTVSESDLNDPEKPVVVQLSYRAPQALQRVGDQLAGTLPAALERDYLELRPTEQRHAPLRFRHPFRFESVVRVVPPPGYEAQAPAADQGGDAFVSWSVEPERDGDAIVLKHRFDRSAGTFPADAYAQLHASAEAGLGPLKAGWVFKPVSGPR